MHRHKWGYNQYDESYSVYRISRLWGEKMSFVTVWVIPIVSGFFILVALSVVGYLVYYFLKILGLFRFFTWFTIWLKRDKVLHDEDMLAYCASRAMQNKSPSDVKKELLLTNKYSKQKIDEFLFAYNVVKKELKGGIK